jgi:hypothetical protein
MVYSLGRYLYLWYISPQLSVLTWFIHLIVTSTSGLLIPVVCTDMVYSLGRYLYLWYISPQLSVLTWFIHLVVTSTVGLLVPNFLYLHGLFTWSLPLLVVY